MAYQKSNFKSKVRPVPISELLKNGSEKSTFDDFVKPKPIDNTTGALASEINLKTCSFDVLLCNLSNSVILKNIYAISQFLQGKNDEHEFENVNKYLEEVLVRIVRNVDVLQSKKFNRHCMRYCNIIIDLLKHAISNRIYMVACIYKNENVKSEDSGVPCAKTLVYKKLYYTSHESQKLETEKLSSIASMSSTPPISRSTSVDSLDSQRSNFNTKPQSANRFISHCLYLMLNFVKEERQLSLQFSGLDKDDANLFYTIFNSVIDESFDNCTFGKKQYRALWEAVKITSLKFEFRIRYLKSSLDTKSMILEKQLKSKSDRKVSLPVETRSRRHESDSTDVTDEIRSRRPLRRKVKKSLERHQAILNKLSPVFIMQSLTSMRSFLSEESEASVIIAATTQEEQKFIKNIMNFCNSSNIMSIFDDEPRKIMEELNKLMEKNTDFKLKSWNKKKCLTGVKYTKIPLFDDPKLGNSRPWYPPPETAPNNPGVKPKDLPPPVSGYQRVWSLGCHSGWKLVYRPVVAGSQSATASTASPAGAQEPRRFSRSKNHFQPGGLMRQMAKSKNSAILNSKRDPELIQALTRHVAPDQVFQPTAPSPARQPNLFRPPKARGIDGRKDQLIEALSVPVQIDKAVKMMVGMGWTGGALGPRGDGIMEPIMPHLGNNSGAGLGHSKQKASNIKLPTGPSGAPPKTKRNSLKFRELFLTYLLDLITSSETSKVCSFTPIINKKENSFARQMIKSFAGRSTVRIEGEAQEIVDEIEDQFRRDPEMVVTACHFSDRRRILFKKLQGLGHVVHTEIARNKRLAICTNVTENVNEFIDQYGALYYSQDSLENTTFKIQFLLPMVKLVKDESLNHVVVRYETDVTKKQKNIVERDIGRINNKAKFGDPSAETVLAEMVQKYLGYYQLKGNFNKDCTLLTVTKEYVKLDVIGANIIDFTQEENNNVHTEYNVISENEKKINKSIIQEEDMSETKDNVSNDSNTEELNTVDSWDNLTEDETGPHKSDSYIIKNDEIKTETNSQDKVTIEDKDPTVKGDKDNDKIIKTDITEEWMEEDHEIKFNTSFSINEYFSDDMSISDQSGFTANLDYNETEGSEDVNMFDENLINDNLKSSDKSIELQCDKSLVLSLKSDTSQSALNVDLDEASQTEEKSDVRVVCLTKTYIFLNDMLKYIQGLISLNIIQTKELPLLKCHGVHDIALVYSCHTKKSYDWLKQVCIANNVTILAKEFDKLSLKLKSYFDIDEKYLFELLELYNKEISTNEWSVFKKKKVEEYMIFDVKMDKKSIKFILDSNFALYFGIDTVTFSIIWE